MTISDSPTMSDWQLKTPVVFIIFNRADTAQKVFDRIRRVKPPKLFVIADGPRADRPGEAEKCAATRAIIEQVDWECEVFKNYSDIKLGCRQRIGATGLPWVFDHVEEAIILEDDCLPHITFFRFCQELLERYRHDERVMAICGTNHLIEWKSKLQSYHFSYHFNTWGWASWRRVWTQFDVDMKLWANPEVKERVRDYIMDQRQYLERQQFFDRTYGENLDIWGYQMAFLCLSQSGMSVIPSRNLIANIGFNKDATNTSSVKDIRANLPIYPSSFPLTEPPAVGLDRKYEYQRYRKLFDRSLPTKIMRKLTSLLQRNKMSA